MVIGVNNYTLELKLPIIYELISVRAIFEQLFP